RSEARFAQAGKTARRKAYQVPGRRQHIQIHRGFPVALCVAQIYTCICISRPPPDAANAYSEKSPMDDDSAVLQHLYECFNARDIDGVLRGLAVDVVWANGMDG